MRITSVHREIKDLDKYLMLIVFSGDLLVYSNENAVI